ncbi:MAG: serine protease [Acidobacteriia bacterium]|nr:serine protease [Terriglobia bacterium]
MSTEKQGTLVLAVLVSCCCFFAGAPNSISLMAQVHTTVGLLRSVYLVKYGSESGTAFVLSAEGGPYFVTAGHVVDGLATGGRISVRTGWDRWEDFTVTRIPLSPKLDIAVLKLDRPIGSPEMWIEAGSLAGREPNLEVYFLGFPYGGQLTLNGKTYRLSSNFESGGISYPAPLVKHGIISGIDAQDPEAAIIFVDAMNNEGFSGAPVVFWDSAARLPRVIGVVTARLPERLMVPRGASPLPAWANSGIVVAYHISGALDAIHRYQITGQKVK